MKIVAPITKDTAYPILKRYHYSPTMPKLTKHYLGLVDNNMLVGVVTLGWGTQPKGTINKLLPGYTTADYYEIGKMALLDSMPRNSESQFLSLVVTWMKKNTTCSFLYTLADGIVGKVGYVYQGSNFLYGGSFWTDVFITPEGEKIHPRSTRKLLRENEKFSGKDKLWWLTMDFIISKGIRRVKGKMFRYMYPLTKKARRVLLQHGWNIVYPKESDLMWKVSNQNGKYDKTTVRPYMDTKLVNFNANNLKRYTTPNFAKPSTP